jgi:hypothetical protein
MKKLVLAIALAFPLAAVAADLKCSIPAKKSASKAEITAMAKVKDDAARKTALDKVGVAGATIHKGGLEVEDGCLIYSYDVKVPNKSGFQEVYVDAGTGAVLKVEHESAAKEAAEGAAAKVKGGAEKAKDTVTGKKP